MKAMQTDITLIHKYSPHIILWDKTWLKNTLKFQIKNFNTIRIDKPNNNRGGIATLIHKYII